jgi:hypothetical protein
LLDNDRCSLKTKSLILVASRRLQLRMTVSRVQGPKGWFVLYFSFEGHIREEGNLLLPRPGLPPFSYACLKVNILQRSRTEWTDMLTTAWPDLFQIRDTVFFNCERMRRTAKISSGSRSADITMCFPLCTEAWGNILSSHVDTYSGQTNRSEERRFSGRLSPTAASLPMRASTGRSSGFGA